MCNRGKRAFWLTDRDVTFFRECPGLIPHRTFWLARQCYELFANSSTPGIACFFFSFFRFVRSKTPCPHICGVPRVTPSHSPAWLEAKLLPSDAFRTWSQVKRVDAVLAKNKLILPASFLVWGQRNRSTHLSCALAPCCALSLVGMRYSFRRALPTVSSRAHPLCSIGQILLVPSTQFN